MAGAGFVGIEACRLAIWSGPGIPGPGFLPLLLAIGLAVGAVGVFLEGTLAGTEAAQSGSPTGSRSFAWWSSSCCIAALVAAIEPLGMLLAVGLFLLVFLAIYLKGHWPTILLIAGGTPVCLYLIFERWLKFTLPRGFLGF